MLLTAGGGGLSDPREATWSSSPTIDAAAAGRRRRRRRRSGPSTAARRWWPTPGACSCSSPGRPGSGSAAASCVVEDEGELRAWLLGGGEERAAAAGARPGRAGPTPPSTSTCCATAGSGTAVGAIASRRPTPGALVLVDGDLRARLADPVVGGWPACSAGPPSGACCWPAVTKHSSLARGGAPLLGQLERGGRGRARARGAMWWAPRGPHPARRRARHAGASPPASTPTPASPSGSTCPPTPTPSRCWPRLAALCDDAAFPGYPYPLTVADRLAACPGWVRHERPARARRPLRQRRRARSRSANGPSPTATP